MLKQFWRRYGCSFRFKPMTRPSRSTIDNLAELIAVSRLTLPSRFDAIREFQIGSSYRFSICEIQGKLYDKVVKTFHQLILIGEIRVFAPINGKLEYSPLRTPKGWKQYLVCFPRGGFAF
jgi:hypothetical protein